MKFLLALGKIVGVVLAAFAIVAFVFFFCVRTMDEPTATISARSCAQHCLACGIDMQRGELADRGHGNAELAGYWIGNQSRHEIVCYRCPRCGILRAFAP